MHGSSCRRGRRAPRTPTLPPFDGAAGAAGPRRADGRRRARRPQLRARPRRRQPLVDVPLRRRRQRRPAQRLGERGVEHGDATTCARATRCRPRSACASRACYARGDQGRFHIVTLGQMTCDATTFFVEDEVTRARGRRGDDERAVFARTLASRGAAGPGVGRASRTRGGTHVHRRAREVVGRRLERHRQRRATSAARRSSSSPAARAPGRRRSTRTRTRRSSARRAPRRPSASSSSTPST